METRRKKKKYDRKETKLDIHCCHTSSHPRLLEVTTWRRNDSAQREESGWRDVNEKTTPCAVVSVLPLDFWLLNFHRQVRAVMGSDPLRFSVWRKGDGVRTGRNAPVGTCMALCTSLCFSLGRSSPVVMPSLLYRLECFFSSLLLPEPHLLFNVSSNFFFLQTFAQ